MIATAIILTGIGSYAMRAFFIFALARYAFPPLLLRALEYVAPTVMAALVISMLTTPEGELASSPSGVVSIEITNAAMTVGATYSSARSSSGGKA